MSAEAMDEEGGEGQPEVKRFAGKKRFLDVSNGIEEIG